tara:strand:+ start:1291 stop:1518 length:228 start_codon:yes stop_codon:yes gene_type:complete
MKQHILVILTTLSFSALISLRGRSFNLFLALSVSFILLYFTLYFFYNKKNKNLSTKAKNKKKIFKKKNSDGIKNF